MTAEDFRKIFYSNFLTIAKNSTVDSKKKIPDKTIFASRTIYSLSGDKAVSLVDKARTFESL